MTKIEEAKEFLSRLPWVAILTLVLATVIGLMLWFMPVEIAVWNSFVIPSLQNVSTSAWFWVGFIGFCVGSVELIARYRDNPRRALISVPALIYILVNICAGIIMLAVLNIIAPDWLFPRNPDGRQVTILTAGSKEWLYLILAAGFGAVALFRSSLFQDQDAGWRVGRWSVDYP